MSRKNLKTPEERNAWRREWCLDLLAAYFLAAGAAAALEELKQVIRSRHCKEKFREKARRIIAYQQICLDVLNGKRGRLKELEQDYENTKSPFHKLSVGRFLEKVGRSKKLAV